MRRVFSVVAAAALVISLFGALGGLDGGPAWADTMLGSCDVVPNPTATDHAECAGDDLGAPVVNGLDLAYADLDGSSTATGGTRPNFLNVDFHDADLSHSTWAEGGVFDDNMQDANLDGISLYDGIESGADFTGAQITNANLTYGWFAASTESVGTFGPSNLTGANLSGTDFSDSQFGDGTDLTNMTDAILTGATFTGTSLIPASPSAVDATSPSGTAVTWGAPQTETGEAAGPCTADGTPVASGSVFPIGTTTVTCEVVDPGSDTFGLGTFTVTVNGTAPQITSPSSATFQTGLPGGFTVDATGDPTSTISETGTLPAGITLTDGVLSGTPAAGTGGSYPITLTAANGVAPDATQDFTLIIDQAPAITSAATTTFTVGTAATFTVTTTGSPAPTVTEAGALPTGVTVTDGVLSGTPAAGTGGSYPITLTAANGVAPDAIQDFTLIIDQAPAITSAATTTFTVGTPATFTVTTTGSPAPTFNEAGPLPSGVTLTSAGVLAGTPASGTAGRYPITVIASNGVNPDAAQNFTLTVGRIAQTVTFISTAPTDAVVDGSTYPVTATGGASGNSVTLTTATPDTCTISTTNAAAPATVTFVGVGDCIIDANQTGDNDYAAAIQATQSMTVGPGSQTITITSTPPPDATVGGPDYTVTSQGGSSGNAVVLTSATPSVCSTIDSAVTFVGSGTCTINANQAGNTNYTAAPQVTQSFPVAAGSQAIAFTSTPPTRAIVGGTGYTVTATGGASGDPVTFTTTTPSTCTVTGATVTFVGVGACTINANQTGNANYDAAPQASQTFPTSSPPPAAGPHLANTPDGGGYWIAQPDGSITAYGDAVNYGSVATDRLTMNAPIVGITATPDGQGYWEVAADGGVFAFGNARFAGSTGDLHLNQPIVAMAATPDGHGYWLVASDGGVFSFGDATFNGSLGGTRLNKPVVAATGTVDGGGYWLVASDGGVFAFGDATFDGSALSLALNKPIVGISRTTNGHGYWLVATDGGVFAFGDASFFGSLGAATSPRSAIGLYATANNTGYTIVNAAGNATKFDAPS